MRSQTGQTAKYSHPDKFFRHGASPSAWRSSKPTTEYFPCQADRGRQTDFICKAKARVPAFGRPPGRSNTTARNPEEREGARFAELSRANEQQTPGSGETQGPREHRGTVEAFGNQSRAAPEFSGREAFREPLVEAPYASAAGDAHTSRPRIPAGWMEFRLSYSTWRGGPGNARSTLPKVPPRAAWTKSECRNPGRFRRFDPRSGSKLPGFGAEG